jgi:hypothetical protein
VAHFADGFVFLPTVERLGLAVPEVYGAFHGAKNDALTQALKTIYILLQRSHGVNFSLMIAVAASSRMPPLGKLNAWIEKP